MPEGRIPDSCAESGAFERHVVLVSPEVHWNTGNIGRTCLGAGAALHLIEPLGFSLESRQVKRAGLDYWPDVNLRVWNSFDLFLNQMNPGKGELIIFAKSARRVFWDMPRPERLFLVFGSETGGLPSNILDGYSHAAYHVPISGKIRCLNLSTAVAVVLYESLRGLNIQHAWS